MDTIKIKHIFYHKNINNYSNNLKKNVNLISHILKFLPIFNTTSAFFFFFFKHVFDCSVGPVHCSRDPQTSFFNNFLIKNGSHDTIHTFKNYFATVFLVFSGIQTDP